MGTVTDYLAGIDDQARRSELERVVGIARRVVPDAKEGTSYSMPALLHQGKPLIAVVQRARHLALYPFSGSIVTAVAGDLEGYSLSSGTIRFDVDRPLPEAVVERVVRLRVAEIEDRA